jgi:hypothetical protein
VDTFDSIKVSASQDVFDESSFGDEHLYKMVSELVDSDDGASDQQTD